MTNVEVFEAVLLANMRDFPPVDRAFGQLGVTREDAKALEQSLQLKSNDRTLVWRAERVLPLLGRPVSEKLVVREKNSRPCSAQFFALPLWQDFLFQLNVDRDGSAWGEAFVQTSVMNAPDRSNLQPWRWTFEVLSQQARTVQVVDRWSVDKDAIFVFDEPNGVQTYLGRFDYDLLQEWSPHPGE